MFDSLRKEIAKDRATLLEELGKISSRVAVMERQSPRTLQTESITHEQSLHIGLSQTEQQSPLEIDTRETAGGTQVEEGTHEWGDHREDELPDYSARIFWEPDSDSEGGGDTKTLSSTTEKIVKNAFCRSLKPDKRKDIKRKQLILDTPFTKVPKLDPTIQSRMSASAKTTDWGLAGMQGYVLDAAVPLVNILESARNGTLTPKMQQSLHSKL